MDTLRFSRRRGNWSNSEVKEMHTGRRTIVCGVLAIALLACGWPLREMYLSERTADAVMAYIRSCDPNADLADEWTISCQAFEGVTCEVVEPDITEPNLGELTATIVGEIGGQYIEHALNNTVTIHCAQSNGGLDHRWDCEINRGSDWEDLPVK